MSEVRRADGTPVSATSPDLAAKLPNPAKFGRGTFVSSARTSRVKEMLDVADPTIADAWAYVLNPKQFALTVPPLSVDRIPTGPLSDPLLIPAGYQDPVGNTTQTRPLLYDGLAAYNMAVRYRITGDDTYAEAAARQIDPWAALTGWSNPTGSSTRLNWAFHFATYLGAAAMIDDSPAMTPTRKAALADCGIRSLDVPGSIAFTNSNNQGDWGVLLVMAIGAYAGNQTVFNSAVARWKAIMEEAVDSNGDLHDEIYREGGGQGNGKSGLHYCLLALTAKILAAELARANGVWLYDHVSASGHTLRGLWDRIMPWLAAPETYPYNSSGGPPSGVELTGENIGAYEIAQRLWPREDAAGVLEAARPIFDEYGAMYLTLTHADQPLRG